MVIFGSGNLTVAGQGKNHETFTGLMIDEKDQSHRPLIEECWRYLCGFAKQCDNFDYSRIVREIPENCTFLDPSYEIQPHRMWKVQEGLNAALLYNDAHSSILRQISEKVPTEEVETITMLSPFYDESGDTLIALSELCPNAKVNVLIHQDCVLPPCKLEKRDRIQFYDFCDTRRGKHVFKTYQRQLHAKIIHFKTKSSEYCVIGSANATKAGVGTMTKRGINDEFGILYHSEKKDFLSLLGLKTKKKIDVPQIRQSGRDGNPAEALDKIRILSASYEAGKLSVVCSKEIPAGTILGINNGRDELISGIEQIKSNKYVCEIELNKTQYICYLLNCDKKCISNKIFIAWPDLLATTNPSAVSRKLNRIISQIEDRGYEGMEVVEILSEVMWDLYEDNTDEEIRREIKGASKGIKPTESALPNLKYNPDYDNDEENSSKETHIDRTSKLIECIEESIRRRNRTLDDAIYEEEEEGDAETSNIREIEDCNDIVVKKKQIKGIAELSSSVLRQYQVMIDKRVVQVRKAGKDFITIDDLNFFSLTMFAAMEMCWLNKSNYRFEEIEPTSRSYYQKQLEDNLERSISYVGFETLERFERFCTRATLPLSIDERFWKVALRTMKYVILYGALFKKLTHHETVVIKEKRLMNSINGLIAIFGKPTIDYLRKELEPLSKRYNNVFSMTHIERMLEL